MSLLSQGILNYIDKGKIIKLMSKALSYNAVSIKFLVDEAKSLVYGPMTKCPYSTRLYTKTSTNSFGDVVKVLRQVTNSAILMNSECITHDVLVEWPYLND